MLVVFWARFTITRGDHYFTKKRDELSILVLERGQLALIFFACFSTRKKNANTEPRQLN